MQPSHTISPKTEDLPFRLRGRNFTLLVLSLANVDRREYFTDLESQFTAMRATRLTPVVLDLDRYSGALSLTEVIGRLRSVGLAPVGTQGGSERMQSEASMLGLSLIPGFGVQREQAREQTQEGGVVAGQEHKVLPVPGQENRAAGQPPASVIVPASVRTGQQICAPEGDIVVLGSVSTGAELVAAGNIHVYGMLRGRALAGIHGDQRASIFCVNLEPELVSIAGIYCTASDFASNREPIVGKSCQISIQDGSIYVRTMALGPVM